jgi:multiple sugar transport system substrate-binding protein
MSRKHSIGRAKRGKRALTLLAAVSAIGLALGGCSGGGGGGTGTADHPVTITFWHGYNLKQDVNQVNSMIKTFEKNHPTIKVKAVANVGDDKILQGVRGSDSPDVVSLFSTAQVGGLCSGGLIDLNPLLKKSGIDKNKVFIKSRLSYTQYKGSQCTLPLLGDTYGLYYNTDMFKAAGITSPPKTWSEFTADAVKLTKQTADGYQQLGFMPSFQGYESGASTWIAQWGPQWSDAQGTSNLATDPQVKAFFNDVGSFQKELGGNQKLEKYRLGFGDEWSAQNAFEVGKVAMQLDGEWRSSLIKSDGSKIHFATAPLPVPDNRTDTYGMGPVTGTVIGVAAKSKHQEAAWQLVKYLTTDTDALVSFANEIWNIPTTVESLNSPKLTQDPNFQTFVKISANKFSAAPPSSGNGNAYATKFNEFAVKWAQGKVPNLDAGLKVLDQQIDTTNAQSR